MKFKKNKTGAMEMSVGTIVTIVLLMAALVLGLVLTGNIFQTSSENVQIIDDQVKNQIIDLFGSSDDNFIVSLGGQSTAKIKQGTENFGIPIGFSPTNPLAWGTSKTNCKYTLTAINQPNYYINKGWSNVINSVQTGVNNVVFENTDTTNGYSLIKISVPENIPPCLQRFSIKIMCTGYPDETVTGSFDVEVTKKGLFS